MSLPLPFLNGEMSGDKTSLGFIFAGEDFETLSAELFLASLFSSSLCCFCLFRNSSLSFSFFQYLYAMLCVSLKNLNTIFIGHFNSGISPV